MRKLEKGEWRLWWEVEEDDDGVLRLQALVPPDFPQDAKTMADLAEARRIADILSGGWKGAYTKGKDPQIPWYEWVEPEVNAWNWVQALKFWCVDPDHDAHDEV